MTDLVTKFEDHSDGSYGPESDLGNELVTKEYMLSVYPNLMPWMKIPSLWTWGSNGSGQLGDGTNNNSSSPVQTNVGGTNWKQVSCTSGFVAAIKTDGTLWMWGWNFAGQLGDDTTVDRNFPDQTIVGGNNWNSVSCGYQYTAAIKTDGTLWTCGYNAQGQLGDGTTVPKSSPIQTIAGGTDWKSVSCGGNGHTAAIKTDGTLWMWGQDTYGQLGDGTTNSTSSPIQTIAGGNNWKSVSCGDYNTVAIKTDGTLWLWGQDDYGQLGDNTTVNKSSPIQTIAGGTDWKSVSCGGGQVAAIKTDGTLWRWGDNYYGQLGDGTINPKSSPIQTIASGTNWKQVSCGVQHTTAIKTDGTLWLCGYNPDGRLGDNTTTNKSSPVQTIAGGTNWKSVSCGAGNTTAISDSEER